MTNPLLDTNPLPLFSKIKVEHIEPAIDKIIADNREKLTQLLSNNKHNWQSLIAPLELMDEQLGNVWSPISHLHSVCNTEELRDVYNRCLQKISEYELEVGQNEQLYNAINMISKHEDYDALDLSQKKIIENALRDFHLSGVNLPKADKARYIELDKRLTELQTSFENNLLDATDHWSKHIEDEKDLAGIPSHAVSSAKLEAEKKGKTGWLFTLEFPSYFAVITYAENRSLRQEIYTAYVTRASDKAQNPQWDNSLVMDEILQLRHQLAQLIDFNNFAELSLATKMANEPKQVLAFLDELVTKSITKAKQEYEELSIFVKEKFATETLEAWDIAYYSEKLRQTTYDISQEELRPFFPEEKVLNGLFNIVNKLYKITIKEITDFEKWHDDVKLFQVFDENHQLRGQFYTDLYARAQKRGGAWVADCHNRCRLDDGSMQTPSVFIVCNFTAPTQQAPALFTHDEVITLFHEFGHALHHMLTTVEYPSISGTNGVEWDAVELPSQFMENWCWQKQALDLISGHYQTGENISDILFQRMLAAKNFQTGMAMVRQLEFSLFDFRIHLEYDSNTDSLIQTILNDVRDHVSVIPTPEFNRFQHGFSHIFAGGYAAGYYSYKWAEVLSSDAFAKFEETGIFNPETGQAFLHNILEMGGSKKALELFVAFRGREPSIEALLRHSGLS